MSAEAFSWAMRQETGSPISKLVLLKLGDHAHADGGGCFPSVATIAEGTELGERTVRLHLRLLEERGLIVSEPRIDERGQRSNIYRLMVPANSRSARPPETGANGRRMAPPPRNEVQGHHAPDSPAPLHLVQSHNDSNRQKEPSSKGAPKRVHPLSGRPLRLAEMIGEARYQAWFGEAEFSEGDPLRIIMPTLMKRNWVAEHFATAIRTVFGESVIIEVQPSARSVAERQACSPRNVDPGGG